MKRYLWLILFISSVLLGSLVIAPVRVYRVTAASEPSDASQAPNLANASTIGEVMHEADRLSARYGHRPPYSGPEMSPGEAFTPEQAQATAPYILACESENRAVGCIVDSNNKLSCGPAQLQDADTFWEPASGIYGDPNSKPIATAILLWGLENGYAARWSCAKIEHIIK